MIEILDKEGVGYEVKWAVNSEGEELTKPDGRAVLFYFILESWKPKDRLHSLLVLARELGPIRVAWPWLPCSPH